MIVLLHWKKSDMVEQRERIVEKNLLCDNADAAQETFESALYKTDLSSQWPDPVCAKSQDSYDAAGGVQTAKSEVLQKLGIDAEEMPAPPHLRDDAFDQKTEALPQNNCVQEHAATHTDIPDDGPTFALGTTTSVAQSGVPFVRRGSKGSRGSKIRQSPQYKPATGICLAEPNVCEIVEQWPKVNDVSELHANVVTTLEGSIKGTNKVYLELAFADGSVHDLLCSLEASSLRNILFFGGDVQDFESEMITKGHENWLSFSLEATLEKLQRQFPASNILIIRPSRYVDGTFSCYDHFLRHLDEKGAALEYDAFGDASSCLMSVLRGLSQYYEDQEPTLDRTLLDLPMVLIGFSKGGIVLNQIISELANVTGSKVSRSKETSPGAGVNKHVAELSLSATPSVGNCYTDSELLYSQVLALHWLDVGNGGVEGGYPSNMLALERLCQFPDLTIAVHTTPYQDDSPLRPWLHEELERLAVNIFRISGDKLDIRRYFYEEPPLLLNHFKLLDVFDPHISALKGKKRSKSTMTIKDSIVIYQD